MGNETSPFILLTDSKKVESQRTNEGRSDQRTQVQENLLISTCSLEESLRRLRPPLMSMRGAVVKSLLS